MDKKHVKDVIQSSKKLNRYSVMICDQYYTCDDTKVTFEDAKEISKQYSDILVPSHTLHQITQAAETTFQEIASVCAILNRYGFATIYHRYGLAFVKLETPVGENVEKQPEMPQEILPEHQVIQEQPIVEEEINGDDVVVEEEQPIVEEKPKKKK